MRALLVTLVAAVGALASPAAAAAQGPDPLRRAAHDGPLERLPPTVFVARSKTPRAVVTGVRTTVGAFPPTRVAGIPTVQDRSRHYALPGDPISVRATTERLRVRLLRVTRTGRPMRVVSARTVRPGRRTTVRLPRRTGVHHELRLVAGTRVRRLYFYVPRGGAAQASLERRTFRPGEELEGELVVTGDAVLTGGVCGGIEHLRDGRWGAPPTGGNDACVLVLATFAPGERFGLGYGRLPEDLPAGRYRYVRHLVTQLDGRMVIAAAEFDVVR